ncbi:zinc ribbon domain-containing protein [bacterium]|nr:zinc ribbon domain-containing protein [bacterium]
MSKTMICPQCHAQLPKSGRFCLECGCDLYDLGVRRPPAHIVPIVLVMVAFGVLVAYAVLHRPGEADDPDRKEVVALTEDVLRRVASGTRDDYRAMVSRYYQPDAERYAKTGHLLRDVVRGSGAPGLRLFQAACMDDTEEADKLCRKYGVPDREYVAGLLGALVFQDGALRTELGGTQFGAQRTLDFVAWYLFLAFRPEDPSQLEVADARWEQVTHGGTTENLYVVTLRPRASGSSDLPPAIAGVASARRLAWRRLGSGKWALTLGCLDGHFRLEDILAFLLRLQP